MHDALTRLHPYCGTWEGEGEGCFPTIPSFQYRERLALEADLERGLLRFEQLAWKIGVNGAPDQASHIEVGAIVAVGAETVELSTIQNGTRYERLLGHLYEVDGALEIAFVSAAFGHDDRMVASSRSWLLFGEQFSYSMSMHTTAVHGLLPHLTATLYRV